MGTPPCCCLRLFPSPKLTRRVLLLVLMPLPVLGRTEALLQSRQQLFNALLSLGFLFLCGNSRQWIINQENILDLEHAIHCTVTVWVSDSNVRYRTHPSIRASFTGVSSISDPLDSMAGPVQPEVLMRIRIQPEVSLWIRTRLLRTFLHCHSEKVPWKEENSTIFSGQNDFVTWRFRSQVATRKRIRIRNICEISVVFKVD
jgi:hypothetical protein